MRVLRKRRRKREMLEFSLNVTSLMDVLTVLLFFLIKSYSVTIANLNTPDGMRLPDAVVKGQLEETLNVALSNDELRVGDKVLVKLDKGEFKAGDIGRDGRTILPLKKVLDDEYGRKAALFKAGGVTGQLPPGKILVQADRALGFGTMKYLLFTAAQSNYNDYEFVVNNPED